VRVNGVAPGAILWPEQEEPYGPVHQEIIERTALKREGTPEDIARTVLFLIRDAVYITGQIVPVDGRGLLGLGDHVVHCCLDVVIRHVHATTLGRHGVLAVQRRVVQRVHSLSDTRGPGGLVAQFGRAGGTASPKAIAVIFFISSSPRLLLNRLLGP